MTDKILVVLNRSGSLSFCDLNGKLVYVTDVYSWLKNPSKCVVKNNEIIVCSKEGDQVRKLKINEEIL